MMPEDWPYCVPGLPDTAFCRGDVPMTRREVRILTLCLGRLRIDSVVYDVGAGTGSLTVEAALLARAGRVYAIERDERALSLLAKNVERYRLMNVSVVRGEAPVAWQDLPPADRILVGGSGGHLAEILAMAPAKLRPQGRLVVNAVTMETLALATAQSPGLGPVEVICVNVARLEKKNGTRLWRGHNPVYVICADKRGEYDEREV